MKCNTLFRFMVGMIVFVIPALADGDSIPPSGRNGGYAERLPRMSRLRETVETDMKQTESADRQGKTPAVKPMTIENGFVICDGRYIPTPYTVRSERGVVSINGRKVTRRDSGQFLRRFVNTPQSGRRRMNRGAAHIERHLREGGLLICRRHRPSAFVSPHQTLAVLEILLGDEADDMKLQKLMQTETPWIASEQWASLIEIFDGPAELSERVQNLKQYPVDLVEEDTVYELHWIIISGITFAGFILAVWALGTLISCRPPMLQGSRAAVLSKRACRQVIWLVILIAVLNMYDLTCTLFAHNAGGLWELNPFASSIIHQNSVVIVFKLGITIGAAILLLVTRRHRLAQIGSWWAGVLYTVLILRWTMFNSMFL